MRFTPEEINNIGVIVEGIEKVIEVISQQLGKFIYDASTKNFRLRKGEIVRNICKDVYQASCLYLTISAPPSNLIEEILVRLYWDKREIAKDLKETYYQFINDVPKIFAIKDENNLYDELFNLKCNLSDLAKTLQSGANIAKMAREELEPAETGSESKGKSKRGRKKDPKVRRRNKEIAIYRANNPKLSWKEIGIKFDVSADIARKACNNPDN